MSENTYKNIKEWRRNTKQKLVEALGGCCQICYYNKSLSALEFHHIIPSQKSFSISAYTSKKSKPWSYLAEEAKKCILLCSNCHREVHDGISSLPKIYQLFDELLITSHKTNESPPDTKCLICDNYKKYSLKFCSQKCANIHSKKIILSKEELESLLIIHNGNLCAIARLLNVSDNGIKKRCIKEGIDPKSYKIK